MAEDDDRDLFEKALESMSADEVYRGKFGGPETTRKSEERNAVDEVDAAELARLRDERMMELAFQGVEKIDGSKYHRQTSRLAAELPDPDTDDQPQSMEALLAEQAAEHAPPQPEPEPDLSTLTEASDRLNLRGMRPDKAVARLAVFVDLATKDDRPAIGVVVGDDDELRRAIRQWFEGPGSIYVRRFEVRDPEGDTRIYAGLRKGSP